MFKGDGPVGRAGFWRKCPYCKTAAGAGPDHTSHTEECLFNVPLALMDFWRNGWGDYKPGIPPSTGLIGVLNPETSGKAYINGYNCRMRSMSLSDDWG